MKKSKARGKIRLVSSQSEADVLEVQANTAFTQLSAELLDFYAGYTKNSTRLDQLMRNFLGLVDDVAVVDRVLSFNLPDNRSLPSGKKDYLFPIVRAALHLVAVSLRDHVPLAETKQSAAYKKAVEKLQNAMMDVMEYKMKQLHTVRRRTIYDY